MLKIDAEFLRLVDIPVDKLFNAVGVYVIWSGRAWVKPTYIGEGLIMRRLSDHMKNSDKCAKPISGLLAIIGDNSKKEYKFKAKILEQILLQISNEIDRFPNQNQQCGLKFLEKIIKRYGFIKVSVSGYDPLLDPYKAKMLKKKLIKVHYGKEYGNEICILHQYLKRSKKNIF
ncbi:MAG: hypothetical protein PHE88_00675 [Elusimicrobia bacterium]|nr:hypothetical protein [Elusimicrobiota bacterium]